MLGNALDSLIRLFEFIVQGILTALVLAYVLVWVHPIKDSVSRNIESITRYMLYPHWKQPVPVAAIAVLLVGGAYFLGVITNVAGYWLLEPIHYRVIRRVEAATVHSPIHPSLYSKRSTPQRDAPYWSTTLLPFRIGLTEGERSDDFRAYENHLQEEVLWGNCKLDAMQDALSPLLKQSRLIRGVVVCALAFSLVAILKAVYFSFVWFLLRFRRPLGSWLYEHTVKIPIPDQREGSEMTDTKRVIQAALIYVLFATAIYLSSVAGWMTVETEYHLIAHYGSQTCADLRARPQRLPSLEAPAARP